jgi:cytochrome c6
MLVAMALASLLVLALCWPPPAWGESLPAGKDGQGAARLFENHCAGCHVNGGNVIRRRRTLRLAALQRNGIDGPEAIARIAAEGIGQMSGYGEVLGEDGVETLAVWVWQRALEGWS